MSNDELIGNNQFFQGHIFFKKKMRFKVTKIAFIILFFSKNVIFWSHSLLLLPGWEVVFGLEI